MEERHCGQIQIQREHRAHKPNTNKRHWKLNYLFTSWSDHGRNNAMQWSVANALLFQCTGHEVARFFTWHSANVNIAILISYKMTFLKPGFVKTFANRFTTTHFSSQKLRQGPEWWFSLHHTKVEGHEGKKKKGPRTPMTGLRRESLQEVILGSAGKEQGWLNTPREVRQWETAAAD